ncbi:hypothetical protein NDU88_004603 [Pleurodeles waltl]|uniref:Uncharacterized protein n=1 Tax=Pleurodeles waltl TaxID=8319 RepID=A0AAV7KY82_PLEWA|nr:hypothetical protein NDU88_004603 [Pleurodeles waltl]
MEARIREQCRAVAEMEERWAQLCKDREEALRRKGQRKCKTGTEGVGGPAEQAEHGQEQGSWVWVPKDGTGGHQEACVAGGFSSVSGTSGRGSHAWRRTAMPECEAVRKVAQPKGRKMFLGRWSEELGGSLAAFPTAGDCT